ncbi:hypothetical protein [Moorena sp. SIO3A2]|uniref:hypothetical protein n=1 Tax=Moorena sp. SIO3A2 TaxID=2607841 RepID=UPI0013BCE89D|nr:hypothetical protein [Moorena sp. SIO3A2]NER89935.1 hypothetical protein [Moorena sp. SIO3A2]
MLPSQNFDSNNLEVNQLLGTSTAVLNPDTSSGTGLPVLPLVRGGTAVALVIALTFFTKTVIEAITKLVKEVNDD